RGLWNNSAKDVKLKMNNTTILKIKFVKLEMVEERLICLSQNIYPAPEVTWATDPPTDTRSLQNFTRKTSDSKGLFTIESSISVIGNISDHTYFCSVVSADEMQVWTASLHHQGNYLLTGSGLLVPCMVTQPCHNFTLTWTFIRTTESIVIFTYDSRTRRTANLWESKAELDIDQAHLGNGSLHLLNPDSLGHSGAYICTFYGFQMRHQVQTHVNITVRQFPFSFYFIIITFLNILYILIAVYITYYSNTLFIIIYYTINIFTQYICSIYHIIIYKIL
uniref:HERV-H LTR-associating 2a, tandem duplicate 2 n=1 Tax=Sinocyclocheilus rhinocerous TaxID=307959 RepID=A0A673K2I8_9TELE